MENWIFSQRHLAVLLRPEKWRLVMRDSVAPAQPQPSHKMRQWYKAHLQHHAYLEILFCLDGRDFYGRGDTIHPTAPGTAICFDSMEPHQMGYPPFSERQEHLWINLLPDQFMARVLRIEKGKLQILSTASILFDTGSLGLNPPKRTSAAANESPSAAQRLRTFSAIAAVVTPLVEHGYRPAPVAPTRIADPQRVMASLMEHLRETGGRGDSLRSLARIAGYSPFHFLRLFKCMTGYTVHTYIDLCRRRKVQELRSQNWSQKAIAEELGFSTPQSFSRWCRGRNA